MNDLVPNYLFPFVLIGTLATIAAMLFGVHKALAIAGWPARDRK